MRRKSDTTKFAGLLARRVDASSERKCPPSEAPVMDGSDIEAMGRPAIVSPFLRPSFSQLGEDRILWRIFADKRDGFYVDIGCNHPFNYSNTALLHICNGWSGVNIDLDPRSIALFEEARPGDINVVAAVGREAGQMEATIFDRAGDQNTLGPMPRHLADEIHEKRMVDVLPLATLLSRHVPDDRTIDFMNVDVEGLDHDVLSSNDWTRYQPTVIAVEEHNFDVARLATRPVYTLLSAQGYTLLSHTVVTSIYRKD